MQKTPLSTLQKAEVLRRQAFKCIQCQTDLEPVGSAPPHFQSVERIATGASSSAINIQAFCPACHAMKTVSDSARVLDEKKRRQRESGSTRSAKKFVKSGFDAQKF